MEDERARVARQETLHSTGAVASVFKPVDYHTAALKISGLPTLALVQQLLRQLHQTYQMEPRYLMMSEHGVAALLEEMQRGNVITKHGNVVGAVDVSPGCQHLDLLHPKSGHPVHVIPMPSFDAMTLVFGFFV